MYRRYVAGSTPVSNSRKLAHLVEQSTHNRLVIGSIPILFTKQPLPWVKALCLGQSKSKDFYWSNPISLVNYSVVRAFANSYEARATVSLFYLSLSFAFHIRFFAEILELGNRTAYLKAVFWLLITYGKTQ